MLQVLDDGRVTDAQGRTVDFKNTVIIMTSNIGAELLLDSIEDGNQITRETKEHVLKRLHQHFRPEFLNRIDEVIIFNPLSKVHLSQIVKITSWRFGRTS